MAVNAQECLLFQMLVTSIWFDWKIWREGDRLLKKSKYIPKRLVGRVEKMETEKVSVEEILEVLKNMSKTK